LKHAYLLLAHHQPALLARLVDRLLDRDAHAFLHIDRSAPLAPFRRAIAALGNPWVGTNLHLVRRRHRVFWFGYSTVEATVTLISEAARFTGFSHYTLLSGVDYPIKSRDEIRRHLGGTDTDFIAYWRLADRPSWLPKIEHYWLTDYVSIRDLRKPSPRDVWRIDRAAAYYFWSAFSKYRKRFPRRRFPFRDLVPYGGSQWWTLTGRSIRYILDFLGSRPDFVRFYRYTQCPDEMVFQTILLNSPLAERAANREAYQRWSSSIESIGRSDREMLPESSFNLRFIDWSGSPEDERGYPAVLDARDFENLRRSECLFARKFDSTRSASLLDRIDSELLADPSVAV
jgi:hypothetical protein